MRSRDTAVLALALALIFGILPNFVPIYDAESGGLFSGDSKQFTWGWNDGDKDTTWFDAEFDDDSKDKLDMLRAAMIMTYIGLGFIALTVLGLFFRDSVSHWGAILAGKLIMVSTILYFYAGVAFGAPSAGMIFMFLSTFFAVIAGGHAMRRL